MNDIVKKVWKHLNMRFLLLFGFSVVNLLFMHGQMALTVEYEYPFKTDAILSNVFSCLIDATFFFFLSLLFTRGRKKGALLLTFVLTASLSFCNVLYSRFFDHYLPNLAILEIGNMNDSDVIGSTLTGFRWMDLYYILMAAVFGWLYVNSDKEKLKAQWLKTIGWLWGAILTCVMAVVLILGFLHDHDFEISITRFSPIKVQYTQAPNNMLFRGGFLRRALVCYDDFIQKNLELDESQKAEIKREYTDYKERSTTVPTVKGEKNLIFIIVPTSPTFWEQDKMNSLYGIEEMYSKFNCNEAMHSNEDLNDEQVFTMALQAETTTAQPFFSLIVTMSMHNPYNKFVEHGFEIADKQYSEEYLNYLIDCHYTDAQIERYINALKQHGLYDNSVIVITSDHQALPVHLNMDEKEVSDELPLFIINGGIDKNNFWTGPCNQLDVYTTLLDIYGVRSEWRGLGHTLLNVKCKEYPIEKIKLLSDWIIRSNYFGLSQ